MQKTTRPSHWFLHCSFDRQQLEKRNEKYPLYINFPKANILILPSIQDNYWPFTDFWANFLLKILLNKHYS